MRVGHLYVTRPEWYDRNASTKQLLVNATITGALPLTTQAQYTIPSGRKAYLDLVNITIFRKVDGTPNALVLCDVFYTNADGSGDIASVISSVSTYGAAGDYWIGQAGIMLAGEAIIVRNVSTFPDGSVDVNAVVKITTYDA